LRKKFDAVKVKMQVEDIQSKALGEKAAGLRSDFVTLLSPLDASAPPRGQAADAYFTELIEGDKDAEIGYFCRGCLRLQQGELSTAIADLDSTINYNAKDSIYRTVRAAAYFRSGRDADGRKDLAEALKLDKKNAWVPYVTALSYFKNGAYTAIEAQLRESTKLNPKFVEALALMALIKSTAVDDNFRNADYALKTAQTAVSAARTPTCTAHLALAVAYAETDDFVQALRYADAALATAAPGPQADWCRACRKAVEEKKAVRIDWKTIDVWTKL
jgi:tetratricopeptide (TPR) repeat protein